MENLGRIGLTEEQADLLEVATIFCRKKGSTEKARKLLDDGAGYDEALWREIVELGWLGIAIPEEFGGVGLGLTEVAPVMEQLGRNFVASPFYVTTLAAQAIIAGGSEEQKNTILPKLAEGAVTTLALAETNNDWTLENIAATATSYGDRYKLSGKKLFVQDAAAANWIIVSVLIDGAPALAIIERDQLPDGALRREKIIDETKRSYELSLDGVTISSDTIMDRGKTGAALKHIDLTANLLASAEMIGGCQAVIDYTIEYLTTRKQFGKLIGSYQALKHPTVDAFVGYEQARSHLYSAAYCFNEQGAGEIAVRMAKEQAVKAYSFAADRSIQFHGGFGFTYDCDAQLHRRRAIWHASQFGDAAWQRARLAELLL
ncbi:MAG: acyl-CoA/acyl-ACP dehydrogenase [Marinicaulis sp.]|nr:acyl-CoA/acyl-ACP dehydrogenase [Marinicaulis sp.]